jgi:hypothetical protein
MRREEGELRGSIVASIENIALLLSKTHLGMPNASKTLVAVATKLSVTPLMDSMVVQLCFSDVMMHSFIRFDLFRCEPQKDTLPNTNDVMMSSQKTRM